MDERPNGRSILSLRIVALVAACVLLHAATAQAALLGLQPSTNFINAQFLEVNYDHTTDQLTVGPGTFGISMNLVTDPITPGTFQLSATIDDTGAISAASLLVAADLELGDGERTYFYSQTIDRFGFGDTFGNDILEFVFLQGDDPVDGTDTTFASLGAEVGVILYGFDASFPGNFESSFSNSSLPLGQTNTFFNPEPSSLSVLVAGALCLLGRPGRSRV